MGHPFGSCMQGRAFSSGSSGRFGFNTQERELEIGEYCYSAEFWIYNSRLGRRWNADPKRTISLSTYSAFANNPILYIDKNGDTINVPRVEDRESILKMINSTSLGTFKFDKNGNLEIVSIKGDNSKYSKYYQEKLLGAIKSENTMEIYVSDKLTFEDGTEVDVSTAGEGVTAIGYTDEKPWATTVISGKSRITEGADGSNITMTPAEILLHELVGHAIPWLTINPDKGNAIDNENKARTELKLPLRITDTAHCEVKSCEPIEPKLTEEK